MPAADEVQRAMRGANNFSPRPNHRRCTNDRSSWEPARSDADCLSPWLLVVVDDAEDFVRVCMYVTGDSGAEVSDERVGDENQLMLARRRTTEFVAGAV